jgi:hypothetical protein
VNIRFWGVRGSFAMCGEDYLRYGGNTAAVEVTSAGNRLLIDLGTGATELAKHLMGCEFGQGQGHLPILLSHTHLRFLAESGDLLGGGFSLPVLDIGSDPILRERLHRVAMTTVPPSLARPWHDILIATGIEHLATSQPELRLARVRACAQH